MTPDEFEKMQENREMTQEEFEFYEDFLAQADFASKEEVIHIDNELAITDSGEVKINPNLELKKYIDARNKQKTEAYRKNKRLALIRENL